MADTTNIIIAQSADDADQRGDDSSFDLTGNGISLGNVVGNTSNGGFRFQNLGIPQGSTINSAYIKLYSRQAGSNVLLKIYGDDVDDSLVFADTASQRVNDRTTTTAAVDWDATWTGGEGYKQSPDIKDIVQEIIDRANWEEGNALTLIIKDDGSGSGDDAKVTTYDNDPTEAAILEINYTSTEPTSAVERQDELKRSVEGKQGSYEMIGKKLSATATASDTLPNGSALVYTITLENTFGLELFGTWHVSFYIDSVADDNAIDHGANVTPGDFHFNIWPDWGKTNNNNIKVLTTVINNSGSQETIVTRANFRFFVNEAS